MVAHAVVTLTADFIVWILPLPALYRARLPLEQRLALIVLFSFGLVVVLAACIRTYWIHYVVEETYDVTWEGFNLWIWTAVELHLGVICGCVPWLKSLFKFWSTTRGSTISAAAGSDGRKRSAARQTVCEGGAVIRMDAISTVGKYPNKEVYMDLDSCRGSGSPEMGPEVR